MSLDSFNRFLNGTPGLKDINIDECIVRVTNDRTVINKNASSSDTPNKDQSNTNTDQKAFMAAIEVDAKRRFRERKEREKVAQGLRK